MGTARPIRLSPVLLIAPLALAVLVAPSASAATTPAASSAEAYGLLVDLKLLTAQVPVDTGPISHASQDYPPGAAHPAQDQVVQAGPIPDDGSLVKHVGVLTTTASATSAPVGVATAETADVSLLADATGKPAISADVVRAQANSDCLQAPNATGTTFVNLTINGTPIGGSPDPNTVIDLGFAKVILNEQHPAADGRGIVVNALHVISTTTGDPLFRGDIVVSHAMSTVSCPNGAGSTGGTNPVLLTKSVSPTSATPGSTLTYTATLTNKATEDCLVTKVIDHLPPGFTFVSTAGPLGAQLDVSPPEARPGGGFDLVLGNGYVLGSSKTVTQTFVVKVGANQAPGTYYNNLEVYCANLGDFVKGLDAPVTVTATPTPGPTAVVNTTSPAPATIGAGGPELPRTGGGFPSGLLPSAIASAAAAAALVARLRRHPRH
jgi:uncharacterized repeat protein (TIGR01451 family)